MYEMFFEDSGGKAFGSFVEKLLIPHLFCDVIPGGGHHADCRHGKNNILNEVKAFRAVVSLEAAEYTFFDHGNFKERACRSCLEHDKGLYMGQELPLGIQAKFQQVKPACFKNLIAAAVFLDVIRVYRIPSKDICETTTELKKGKIKLESQHGNKKEGQIFAKDLGKYQILSISEKIEIDLSILDKKERCLNALKNLPRVKFADYLK
jgi:hypothetical protein